MALTHQQVRTVRVYLAPDFAKADEYARPMRDALTDETFHYMLGVQFQVPRNMVEYFQSRQNTDATFVIRKQKPGFFGVLRNLFRK